MTPRSVRLALEGLRTGSESLNFAYDQALERIDAQTNDPRQLAKNAITWIVYAARPLTLVELQYALAVEEGATALDTENIARADDIISVCKGPVSLDEGGDIIRLVHYTTQVYFDATLPRWAPGGHKAIAMACLTYMSFDLDYETPEDGFAKRFRETVNEREHRYMCSVNPFLDYAANYWASHYERSEVRSHEEICILLKRFSFVIDEKRPTFHFSPLHNAARLGQAAVIRLLLQDPRTDVNAYWDQNGPDTSNMALGLACGRGYENIVNLLLEKKDIQVNLQNWNQQTALILAAEEGYDDIVRSLLERHELDLNVQDCNHFTALTIVAYNGHKNIVRLLLNKEKIQIHINSECRTGSPLIMAAAGGHISIVNLLLLREDIRQRLKGSLWPNPLIEALEYSHVNFMNALFGDDNVRAGAEKVNVLFFGRTERRSAGLLGLFTEKIPDLFEGKNRSSVTALTGAFLRGFTLAVKQLQAYDEIRMMRSRSTESTSMARPPYWPLV